MVTLSGTGQAVQPDGWQALILNSSNTNFWALAGILAIAGLACGLGIFYFIRRARLIEDTPTSRIRSAPQGYVEIIGRVKYLANEAVTAPLTLLPCAWYHYKIEKQETVHTGKGSHTRWRTIEERTSERAFVCVDDTGQCMIDPRGAEVHTQGEDSWQGASKWPQTGKTSSRGFFSLGSYRYTERRLIENDPLYALGKFTTVDPNKAHGDVSDETRAILKVWKQDQAALLKNFDTNGDGSIDLDEWETVRRVAEQQAYQQRLSRADKPAIHMLSRTNDFRRPYILSVRSPLNMANTYKLKAAACALGFVLLVPVSIWMIIVRLSA